VGIDYLSSIVESKQVTDLITDSENILPHHLHLRPLNKLWISLFINLTYSQIMNNIIHTLSGVK
jgi:hypothetical protein